MTDARDADTFNAETYLDSAGSRIRLRPRGLGHHFLRMRRFNSARGLQSSWTLFKIYHPAGRERVEDTPQGLRGGGDEQVTTPKTTRGSAYIQRLRTCHLSLIQHEFSARHELHILPFCVFAFPSEHLPGQVRRPVRGKPSTTSHRQVHGVGLANHHWPAQYNYTAQALRALCSYITHSQVGLRSMRNVATRYNYICQGPS